MVEEHRNARGEKIGLNARDIYQELAKIERVNPEERENLIEGLIARSRFSSIVTVLNEMALTLEDIAKLGNVIHSKTAGRWARGVITPSTIAAKHNILFAFKLSALVYDSQKTDSVSKWFKISNPSSQGQTPIELLRQRDSSGGVKDPDRLLSLARNFQKSSVAA